MAAPMGVAEQGLFSLVEAATISRPIPTVAESSVDATFAPGSYNGPNSLGATPSSAGGTSTKVHAIRHRRLSSTGQARRRLSEAREATSRPSPAMLHNAAATISSLASLSLSGSPPPPGAPHAATSLISANGQAASGNVPKVETQDDDIIPEDTSVASAAKAELNSAGISVTKSGKKRGTIFKCESCSKVYRHPSCLIKHRWEHSPHWRESSKFLLSKHQQVQLLEAAAILSHLAPSASGGTSLPEDRSLWPSFLSGGALPPPDQANLIHDSKKTRSSSVSASLDQPIAYPVSSSVPAPSLLSSSISSSSASGVGSRSGTATSMGRSPSAGPRMHDYALPPSGGLTHVRPGVVGVPTNPSTPEPDVRAIPIRASSSAGSVRNLSSSVTHPPAAYHHRSAPVPVPTNAPRHAVPDGAGGYSFVSGASVSDAWSSPVSLGFAQSSFRSSAGSASFSASASASGLGRSFSDGAGGWSLPHSSLRSASGSGSRSGSGSADGDEMDEDRARESEYVDVEGEGDAEDEHARAHVLGGRFGFTARGWRSQIGTGKIEEEWDGMEMEMEM